ncbi:MAG: tetratricopeptide (TPR) repeat protein [Arenicella sp.]
MDSEQGIIYYRHINGVLDAYGRRQIFDLAKDFYDPGYPQHFISKDQALALVQNNKAMSLLRNGSRAREQTSIKGSMTKVWSNNTDNKNTLRKVIHARKITISPSPSNPDLWVNTGVVMKRAGRLQDAETTFLYSLALDKNSAQAASNLEHFYQKQGNIKQALAFKKKAGQARLRNPY